MPKDEVVAVIYKTNNLTRFKQLVNNRELKQRVSRVKASIEKHGWIPQPIICNEKFEVIDGQARLQACKELESEITYAVIPGMDIDDCRILNSINSNWDYLDYIKSYAMDGNQNYRYIEAICSKMKNEWGHIFIKVLGQIIQVSNTTDCVKSGEAKLTVNQYNEACVHIAYLTPIIKTAKVYKVCNEKMASALYFTARKAPDNVKARLPKAFEDRLATLKYKAPSQLEIALEMIDDIYNYNRTKSQKFSIKRVYEDEGFYG